MTGLSPEVEVDLEAPEMSLYPSLANLFKPIVVSTVRQQLENELKKLIKYF